MSITKNHATKLVLVNFVFLFLSLLAYGCNSPSETLGDSREDSISLGVRLQRKVYQYSINFKGDIIV